MSDEVVYIDVDAGSKRVMNNIKLYVRLLNKFKDDPGLGEVEAALSEGNMERAQNSAHALKGLSANLSLTELYNNCLELERQIKSGSVQPQKIADVKSVYAQTLAEVDKVVARYG